MYIYVWMLSLCVLHVYRNWRRPEKVTKSLRIGITDARKLIQVLCVCTHVCVCARAYVCVCVYSRCQRLSIFMAGAKGGLKAVQHGKYTYTVCILCMLCTYTILINKNVKYFFSVSWRLLLYKQPDHTPTTTTAFLCHRSDAWIHKSNNSSTQTLRN